MINDTTKNNFISQIVVPPIIDGENERLYYIKDKYAHDDIESLQLDLTSANTKLDDLDNRLDNLNIPNISNLVTVDNLNNTVSNFITRSEVDNTYVKINTLLSNYPTNQTLANYVHKTNGIIDNATIDYTNVNNLNNNYAHITNNVIDNATIIYSNVNGLYDHYAHINNNNMIDNAEIDYTNIQNLNAHYAEIENGKIKNATIDQANVENLNTHYAEIENGKIKNATIDQANVENLNAHYAEIENGVIKNATIDQADVNNLNTHYAEIEEGKIKNATIDQANVENLNTHYAEIENGRIKNATIDQARVENLNTHYAEIENGVIKSATIDQAKVNNLDTYYAHINNGVIDNASINQANVKDLSANYARIDLINVTNSWIKNGVIRDAAITDAKILGVSANKLTAGTIDASNINVTNLRADNLTVTRINGQPVIGGYIFVDPSSTEYYDSKNPLREGWYEFIDNTYVLSTDGVVYNEKRYYKTSDSVELYDQSTIDAMVEDINTRIDSQIETWTTEVVPTLTNYPAEDWTTDDLKQNHVGDICYVINPTNNYDGFTYRFAYDNRLQQYVWVLIKDNQVTAALGRLTNAEGKITGLETFKSNTNTWITQTDQGLETIRNNYTTLSGRVDKTVKSTVQLWFTKANTTAPSIPIDIVTNDNITGTSSYNQWNLAVPEYNANYPYYYYCWQYIFEDDTVGWSAVIYDSATTEAEERARTGIANAAAAQNMANSNIKSSVMLWFSQANDTSVPQKPNAVVTNNNPIGDNSYNKWNLAVPVYNSSYPYYYYCYQQQKGDGTYQWTDVVYDRAITETQNTSRATASSLSNYMTTNEAALQALQNQIIDGQLDIWYGSSDPTTTSAPASNWDADEKAIHVGDMYYNTTTGSAWHWMVESDVYSWIEIPDSAAAIALSAAQDAQATADGKRRVFITTPTVPYDVGDLWVDGNEVKYATVVKTESQSYSASDWAQTATDDTAAIAAQQTANQNIKSTVQLWFSKANNTAPNAPTSHVTSTATTGNAWTIAVPAYDNNYPYYYYCYEYQKGDGTYFWSSVIYDRATTETQSTARATSSSLSNYITNNDAALATLQSQVDNQLEVWYGNSNPTNSIQPASSWDLDEKANHVGDLYYNTTDGSAWQWTVDNSTYSWTQIPDSAASAALAAAQDAQATADGKRRIFTSTPTVPYDIGDLWVTGNQVKYATVNKTESQNYAAADWSQTATDDTMASANIKSSVQLWYTSNSTTSPNKPYTDGSSNYVSSTSTNGNIWTTVVPLYNSSTPKYHYCYQQQRGDGTYQWTTPVYDDATTTAMVKAQSALPSATFIEFENSTFKDVVDTVEEQSTSITNLTTITENNGLTSSTNITNSVSTLSQTVNGITADIESLQSTVDEKADESTVESLQSSYNTLSETVDGHTQSIGSINNTLTTKADGSTVTSLTTRVNDISDTVDGHTSSLSSITSTQTSMQNTLNKTVKASIQLWYSKQNTTAPNPPSSQVTNSSINGGAWTTVVPAYNASYPNYYYCYQYELTDGTYDWSAVVYDQATTETQSTARTATSNLANYITTNNAALQTLQNQVDGQIEAWYYSVDPTTSNAPAEDWTTDTLKSRHEGDLYYNVSNGHSWRWLNTNGTYDWQQIPDSDAAAALAAAQNAQTTANNKRRIFTTTPTVPYDVGDLWVNGSEVKYAINAKTSTGTYAAADWTQTATDDTAANAAQDTANANIKSSTQLWFTKADATNAPNKPTTQVTTSNANTTNAWNLVVPIWNSSYPHYYYCYQQQKGNGTWQWTDVVYDRATSEAQQLANTVNTNVNSLQLDYANFKQTTQNFESTIGTTYATKTELQTTDNKIENLEIGGRNLIGRFNWSVTTQQQGIDYYTCSANGTVSSNNTDSTAWSFANCQWQLTLPAGTYQFTTVVLTPCETWASANLQIINSSGTALLATGSPIFNNGGTLVKAFTLSAETTVGIKIKPGKNAVCRFKLEKGNKATDWTPAPEDVDAAIEASPKYKYVTSAYKAASQTYNKWLQWGQEGHSITNFALVDAAERRKLNIGDLACCEGWNATDNKPIYIVIEVTEFPSTTHYINGISHGLIDSEIRSTVNAIESRVSSAETSITQTNNQIALKANASDVYTKTQTDGLISTEVSNRNSAIEQSAAAINLSVSETYTTKTEFNALEIGGRNLFSWPPNGTKWKDEEHALATYQNRGSFLQFFGSLLFDPSETVGDQYTISLWAKSPNGTTALSIYNNNSNPKYFWFPPITLTTALSNEWEFFSLTVTNTEYNGSGTPSTDENHWRRIEIYAPNAIGVLVKQIKVEKGNRATDWTPAPEDMVSQTEFESAKSEIKATTDGITSTVEKISSIKYVNSAYSSWTLANIKTYSTEGYNGTWNVNSTTNLRVGDTVYIKGTDGTRNCTIYIKTTVSQINSATQFAGISHGYEDNLPIETIKSTINQSADSVKIQARHVEIDGAAIFSNSDFKAAADAAYDPIGSAAAAQSAAASDATTKANNAKSAAISTAASDATTKANNAKSAAISAAATDATNKANAAQAAAISAAATDATNKADAAQSAAISAAATDATNKANAVQTNLDNLEIGGRNLLTGTSTDWTEVSLSASQYFLEVHTDYILEVGQTYTFSIIVEKVSSDDVHIHLTIGNGNKGAYSHDIASWNKYHIPFGEVVSITHTITEADLARTSSDTTIAPYFSYRLRNEKQATTIRYRNVKLEKGTKATDWTPAPEDVDANIAAVQTIANSANAQEQIIYKSAVSGTNSMLDTTSWVTNATGAQNTWTIKRPQYDSDYPVLFVATQHQTVGGIVTCTTPLKDDTLTVIDGGHITTGTIDASVVTVTNLNANNITSGSLASTNYQEAAAGIPYSIAGSKIELSTGNIYTPSFGVINSSSNANYPVGLYINDGFVAKSGKIGWSSENYWDVGTLPINSSTYTTGIVATGNSLINVGELILESNDDLNNNASLHTGTISKSSTTYTRNYLRDPDNYYRDYGLQAPVLDSTAANYTAGVDDNFIYIKKSHTDNNTLPTLESDWDYLFRIDKEGNLYTTGSMYINGQLVQSGGNFVKISGDSTINGTLTITNGSLIGQLNKSITFAASGGASAGSIFNNTNNLTVSYATVGAASAGHTHDYLPLSGGTLSGNLNFSATSSINWTSGAVRQRILITDDSTANTNVFEFQQSTNSGSSYTSLFTIKDNGTVVATTFSGALSGNATSATTATSATKDSEGNQISTTYLKRSGGTLTGDLTTSGDIIINGDLYTNNELYADSETVGSLIVTGNAIFNNGLTGNLIGTAEKATKDSAGNQINTTYIKGLSISGKTITYTKGDNTTGTITTQDTTYTNGTGLSLNGTQFYVTSANVSTMINLLTESASPANRNDYAVVQYANGGTTTTTYHRRKLSNVFAALNASDITTALGFTPYNNTNPNSFTSNTGTVTSVTLKAGSGITLDTDNTAITTTGTRTISHADTSSQASITASDRTYIKSVTLDTYGHVTGLTTGTESVTDTHYTAYLYAGTSTGSANAQTTNGNTYLILKDGNNVSSRNKITGSGTVSVASDANGVITITGSTHPTSLKNPNALAINVYNGSATATTTNYDGSTANQSVNVASNNAITGISASTSGGSTTFTLTTAAGGTSTFDVNVTGAVVTGATTLTDSNGNNINAGGATTAPVYFSEGLPVAVTSIPYSLISGKPTITLNGSATNTPSWYAPTGAGTSGQILKSNGSGAPSWVNTSTITAGAATKATNDSDGNAINSTYLKKSGDTLTGDLILQTSTNDSPDIVWKYSDGTEKMRIWSQNEPTAKAGPNYRIYNSDGTALYSGTLVLSDGTGASGTWGISITGNATTATSATAATTASKLGSSNVGASDRPIYLSAGTATQTTYRMAATNTAATTARVITDNLETGIWYVNGTNSADLYSQADGVAYVNQYSDKWIAEIYQDYRTGQIALRGKNNGTWQAWRKVLDSSNFNTWTPKLDGTGATGSWGISITGSAGNIAWNNISNKPVTFITNTSALNTNGWKTLGGRTSQKSIAISYASSSPATWNSESYSASIVFGCNDTKGMVDVGYANPIVTFGGGSVNGSTDDNPKWYFKFSGTSGQTYTFPSTSKTLAATDGTGASGTWGISISGTAATASAAPWSGITDKPATATRWPAWNEISQTGANSIEEGGSDLTDNSEILTSYASNNGFADSNATGKVYRRDAIHVYNYIKGKTDNVYVKKSGDTMTGALTATNLAVSNTSGTSGYGIALYGSTNDVWNYGMAFAGTSTYGKHGVVQGDWATYFTMTGANNRGWIFKHGGFKNTSGNVASINGQGQFQGLSYSVNGHCNLEYNTTTESLNFVFS